MYRITFKYNKYILLKWATTEFCDDIGNHWVIVLSHV